MSAISLPSTRHPERLPAPAVMRDRMRATALLDSVFEPEWDLRYYSFGRKKNGPWLGSMRNGEGDLWYAWFLPDGAAVIRGFDHDSAMSPFRRRDESLWPRLFEGMPAALETGPWQSAIDKEVTFVLWHAAGDRWRTGPVELPPGDDPDGSEWLLRHVADDAVDAYARHARAYFGLGSLDVAAVQRVFDGHIDAAAVAALSPTADAREVLRLAREMGLPSEISARKTRKGTTKR